MLKPSVAFLLFPLFTFTLHVTAQLNPNNISVYSEMEGAGIYDVITDRMGNVWMATGNGLVRFDGYEYRRFYHDPNDSTSMGSILTYRLYEDDKGNIMIGCMDFISVFDLQKNAFKNYRFAQLTDFPYYSQPVITAITSDLKGRIYFGVASYLGFSATHTLVYKEPHENRLRRFEYPDSIEVRNVFRAASDKQGNVWIAAENGFFRIGPGGIINKAQWPLGEFPSTHQYYLNIKSSQDGWIWITSAEALLHAWNPADGEVRSYSMKGLFEKYNGGFFPNDLEIDTKGNIWLGTNHGLIRFEPQSEKFEILEDNPDYKFLRSEIFSLTFDSFENLWIGTASGGLLKYGNRPVLTSYVHDDKDKSSITGGWVNKIFEAPDGRIWMATSGGVDYAGLNVFDPEIRTISSYPCNIIIPGIEWAGVIGKISREEILITTSQGFFVFSTDNKLVKKYMPDSALNNTHIFNLDVDSRGNQWYCTNNGLYLRVRDNESLRSIIPGKADSANATIEVTNIYESNKNRLWVLTNGGLFLYDYNTDQIERHGFDKEKGDVFLSQDINSFYEDSDGTAWVGTWGGGLSRYNVETRKIKTYTTSDGLPSMSIQGILADEKNKALWLSTFDGISRFTLIDEQFNNFSPEDGIQGRLFADGAYLKTSGGLFLFGGSNGITVFDPQDIAKNSIPPKVYITDFKISSNSILPDYDLLSEKQSGESENIVLSYSQNNISFDYTGIHYANPARNQFAYKLENYDEDWREVGNLRTAYYYDLPPGKYTFRVIAANSNGVWNEEGATISIKITPPWWRTWWAYGIYGILLVIAIFLFDRYMRRRLLEKAHRQAREKELEQARAIEKAYKELQETQSQLIQSEKMASLGELTAGIAHEIQNPLNFVNNFSEVSHELIDEMKEAMAGSRWPLAVEIAEDIKQNLKKINNHGKRADAIVKGMLQHSRTSNGQKEPTDINALTDEYLRLAYHGLRAKDKSFRATMKTDLDESIGKINVNPQDLGRVILNLIANAFYAVHEKKGSGILEGFKALQVLEDYEPTVSVSTKKIDNKVLISIEDNGNGIPEHIKDKIFQPFFTTKPAGQGTGLGLSLSYDIIKAHGGELKVESKVGEGAEFIIYLPV